MPLVVVGLKERAYPVHVQRGLLPQLGSLIKKQGLLNGRALVVSQKQVAVYTERAVSESLANEGFEFSFFITPQAKSSEAAKSEVVFSKLVKRIASYDGKHKSIFLIALGGGVIGDLTGFAASVYRRGIPYIQIPTTLTAQVDSAVGGKTGIDLPEGKNLLGSIYQPALVLSDSQLLDSLPERHWSDGFAEVIKYGVTHDPALFALLENKGKEGIKKTPRLLDKVIHRCARIKAKIVEKDEWDKKGLRMVLNFGHTAGHAIEAASKFSRQYTHGEAVAIGMLVACDIAEKLGVLKERALTGRLEKTLMKFELPLFYRGLGIDTLLKAIGYDKKSDKGLNRFVLPVSFGKTALVRDVPLSAITDSLERRKG